MGPVSACVGRNLRLFEISKASLCVEGGGGGIATGRGGVRHWEMGDPPPLVWRARLVLGVADWVRRACVCGVCGGCVSARLFTPAPSGGCGVAVTAAITEVVTSAGEAVAAPGARLRTRHRRCRPRHPWPQCISAVTSARGGRRAAVTAITAAPGHTLPYSDQFGWLWLRTDAVLTEPSQSMCATRSLESEIGASAGSARCAMARPGRPRRTGLHSTVRVMRRSPHRTPATRRTTVTVTVTVTP